MSPAAKMPGALLSMKASTTTPRSSFKPACSARSVRGRTPTPIGEGVVSGERGPMPLARSSGETALIQPDARFVIVGGGAAGLHRHIACSSSRMCCQVRRGLAAKVPGPTPPWRSRPSYIGALGFHHTGHTLLGGLARRADEATVVDRAETSPEVVPRPAPQPDQLRGPPRP